MRPIYKYIIKPILFLFSPEFTHNLALFGGKMIGSFSIFKKICRKLFRYDSKFLETKVFGIKFKNPVGLSAGFDKQADLVSMIDDVGFGFMELGTVTTLGYKGNKKPRQIRLKKSKGLVVNYGLKNLGVEKTIAKLRKKKISKEFVIGISIGKTNNKENVDAKRGVDDYVNALSKLYAENIGQYYTLNISCPNTFGGEPFTQPSLLEALLKPVSKLGITKPIFLKMPIDLPWKDFDNLLKIAIRYHIDGVIIGNLTKKRELIKEKLSPKVKGGISGKPCEKLSNELIAKTYQKYGRQLTIVGVGGIFSANDAYEKIKRGASLVQLITGMIYEGPQLIGEINKGIEKLAREEGFKNISEAVGSLKNS